MDIGLNTLLVALMFVTILSMGIGNILVTMADNLNHATASRRGRVHVAWIVLLLFIHFNLFWHTKAILEVETWRFGGFLLTMAGPALLFFATSVLLTNLDEKDLADPRTFFLKLCRPFFLLFAAVQVWIVLADVALVGTVSSQDAINVGFAVLAVFLALVRSERSQVVGVVLAWSLGVISLIMRGVVISG